MEVPARRVRTYPIGSFREGLCVGTRTLRCQEHRLWRPDRFGLRLMFAISRPGCPPHRFPRRSRGLRRLVFALVLTCLSCAHREASSGKSTTARYEVWTVGRKSGSQVTEVSGNERTVSFEYNDRGRGPN